MKAENRPCVGQRFVVTGIEYEIAATHADGLRYSSVKGGRVQHLSWSKFEELLESGKLKLHRFNGVESLPGPDELSPTETETMNRRLAYVRGIDCRTNYPNSRTIVKSIIEEVSGKIGDKKPPSFSTVSSWHGTYTASGRNPMSLVPRMRNKGNRYLKFHPVVEQIINSRINEDYLSRQRVTKRAIHAHVVGQILEQFGEDNLVIDNVAIPSERTIYRRISQLDPFHVVRAREGANQARRRLKAAGSGVVATRILERVEADGNLMDVLVVDEDTGEVVGRPYGTCLIDQFSRCVLAFHISMIPFSSTTLLHSLKLAVSGNGGRKGGLFETLVVDNGPDYISNSIRNFCNRLGKSTEHGPPRDPDSKPHVERFFGTLNTQLVHLVPGTTFSNPDHRGEYDSSAYACVTMTKLQDLVWEWVDNVYHRSIMRGHGRVPEVLWNEAVEKTPTVSCELERVDSIARDVIRRTISGGRVTAYYLSWYSHALATLEQYLRTRGLSRKVDVYVDPLNLAKVFIRDPRDDRVLIQADCTRTDYATELSLFEHKQVLAEVKSQGEQDLADYGPHQLEIERWKPWKKLVEHGKGFARKKIARIKEIEKRNRDALDVTTETATESRYSTEIVSRAQTPDDPSTTELIDDFHMEFETGIDAELEETDTVADDALYSIEKL